MLNKSATIIFNYFNPEIITWEGVPKVIDPTWLESDINSFIEELEDRCATHLDNLYEVYSISDKSENSNLIIGRLSFETSIEFIETINLKRIDFPPLPYKWDFCKEDAFYSMEKFFVDQSLPILNSLSLQSYGDLLDGNDFYVIFLSKLNRRLVYQIK